MEEEKKREKQFLPSLLYVRMITMSGIKWSGMSVNGSLYPSISYAVDPEVLTEFVYRIVIISAFRDIMSSLVIGCQQTEKLQVTPPLPPQNPAF